MTEQDKQLLLTDLCARLPYEVKVEYQGEPITLDYALFAKEYSLAFGQYPMKFNLDKLDTIKPYLRPMSSMTEEEMDEYLDIVIPVDNGKGIVEEEKVPRIIDFYYSHHIDYRGLIEKGLALEAPENMYKID